MPADRSMSASGKQLAGRSAIAWIRPVAEWGAAKDGSGSGCWKGWKRKQVPGPPMVDRQREVSQAALQAVVLGLKEPGPGPEPWKNRVKLSNLYQVCASGASALFSNSWCCYISNSYFYVSQWTCWRFDANSNIYVYIVAFPAHFTSQFILNLLSVNLLNLHSRLKLPCWWGYPNSQHPFTPFQFHKIMFLHGNFLSLSRTFQVHISKIKIHIWLVNHQPDN